MTSESNEEIAVGGDGTLQPAPTLLADGAAPELVSPTPVQASLLLEEENFDADGASASNLARQLAALLHTGPLHAHEASKQLRGEQDYDLLTVQLKVIDFVTDNQTLDSGPLESQVLQYAVELLHGMQPERGGKEHQRVALSALRNLVNDGRGAIVREIQLADGSVQRSEIELMREELNSEGEIELRASDQAINLFIEAFDLDISSAQDAYRSLLRAQLQHGRFGRAAQVAKTLERLSRSWQEQVRQDLVVAQRDISRLDWSGQVQERISQAYLHVTDSVTELGQIQLEARSALDSAEGESRGKLQEVARLLQSSLTLQWALLNQLLPSRQKLLDLHAAQMLAPVASLALVDPDQELLQPVMHLPVAKARPVLEAFTTALIPPQRQLADLYGLVAHLCRERRETSEPERPIELPQLEEIEEQAPIYSEAQLTQARNILARPFSGQPLRALLEETRDPRVAELVAFGALFAFGVDAGLPPAEQKSLEALVPAGLRAQKLGTGFVSATLWGDDLALTREEA